MVSVGHEKFDFSSDKPEIIGKKTRTEIRRARNPKSGLLIVYLITPQVDNDCYEPVNGIAISFPKSENAASVVYVAGDGYDLNEE